MCGPRSTTAHRTDTCCNSHSSSSRALQGNGVQRRDLAHGPPDAHLHALCLHRLYPGQLAGDLHAVNVQDREAHDGLPFPKSGFAFAMTISPHGTVHSGGSVHAMANPVLYDRLIGLCLEAWAGYNTTVEHTHKMTGALIGIGCDRRPGGGLATLSCDVARLRMLLQRLLCQVASAVTPELQTTTSDNLMAQARKAGVLSSCEPVRSHFAVSRVRSATSTQDQTYSVPLSTLQ